MIFRHLPDYIGNCQFIAFIISILRIAIRTIEITAGQPDKNAGESRPGRLALDAVKNLVYFQIFSPVDETNSLFTFTYHFQRHIFKHIICL
jgi:hypothetical protein